MLSSICDVGVLTVFLEPRIGTVNSTCGKGRTGKKMTGT